MIVAIVALIAFYGALVFGGRLGHRHFVYKPDRSYTAPADVALNGVDEVRFAGAGGQTLIAWHARAEPGMPTILFFTGNGGSTATHALKFAEIQNHGYGVMMLNYRGYGGSEGRPSEAGNVADAQLAYDWLLARGAAAGDIVAYGESLGTSVATQLAAARPVRALVLEAPFSSIIDVARKRWWFLPLKFVMVDQYNTIDVIHRVTAPVLIVHGAQDSVIDLSLAERLFEAARQPKQMEVFPEADHSDLYEHGAFAVVDRYLKGLAAPVSAGQPVAAKA
jgi:fermentation-respiration switch protein FrsA (DUF1100 family)